MNEADTRQFMARESRRLTGAMLGIPARLMKFPDPVNRPRYPFFGGNVLANSLFAVFSAIFPPGERFFVESVRPYRDQLDDDELKAKVSGFIGQESIHGREHEQLNRWFIENGYDIAMPDRMIRFSLGLLERLPQSMQAACTNFMEHVTANLAEQWLDHEKFRATSDTEAIKLWTWHALEELEHKTVVFEVHKAISRFPYLERLLAPPLVVAALLPGILFSWAWILIRQGEAFRLEEHREGINLLFGKNGFLTKVLAHVPDYLARDFHPDERDTKTLENQWRDNLFGAQGQCNAYFTNRDAVLKAAG